MSAAPSLVWFRRDLRLNDNPALHAALAAGGPVIPVFVWSPDEEGAWAPGAASRWWLHHSLAALQSELAARGSRLVIDRGPSADVLRELVKETGATAVFLNRRYEPEADAVDAAIARELTDAGLLVRRFAGGLAHEPADIRTGAGKPYQVFTAFWNAWSARPPVHSPAAAPKRLDAPARWPVSEPLEDLDLLPAVGWDKEMRETWTPGEPAARKALRTFLVRALEGYDAGRDRPFEDATSRLSAALHFGELGVRETLAALEAARRGRPSAARAARKFEQELAWREFAHYLLVHFPHTADRPLRPAYEKFPWRRDPDALKRWQAGKTGFPIVDAGMRQLWRTGWMHNRVRMIVASFLVKDLLIDWREGARWFWDTLVDADLANNTLGWQWAAGCGADAAPFFRIFNPVLQGEKFDPDGIYVRRWVPELKDVSAKWIHRPWDAPPGERPARYPAPIVDHSAARNRALAAFRRISASGPRRPAR